MGMSMGSFATRVVATAVVATDGTGDFTTIQEAIDSLPAGGGVVYVKEGIYTITAAITIPISNVSIIGSGTSTRIQTFSDITMFNITAHDGTHLNKLLIYGDVTKANNIGIYMGNVHTAVIRDCQVMYCGSHGISTNEGTYNLLSGCTIVVNEGDGIHMVRGVGGSGAWTISESYVSSNKGSGIYMDSISQMDIPDNEISFNENYGIYKTNGGGAIITGNVMVMNYWDGIRINACDEMTINVNGVSMCGFLNGGTGDGIRMISSDDSNISNNTFSWNAGWDINISNAACVENIVIGNRCKGGGVGTINDAGTGTELGHNKEG